MLTSGVRGTTPPNVTYRNICNIVVFSHIRSEVLAFTHFFRYLQLFHQAAPLLNNTFNFRHTRSNMKYCNVCNIAIFLHSRTEGKKKKKS